MTQEKFKFPRTFHFPDSGSVGSDDKIFHDWEEMLWGKPVEITWKMMGRILLFVRMVLYTLVLLTPGNIGAVTISHLSGKLKGGMLYLLVGESL